MEEGARGWVVVVFFPAYFLQNRGTPPPQAAGLPGTSVSEDSLAEFSIGSLPSEDLCKWKLEAMSWDACGVLRLSGSLSKFIPPLKESISKKEAES